MMATDLQIAVAHLTGKKARYDRIFRYYDGDQPLVYSSEKLHDIFRSLDARFTENWCAVVADAALDRLALRSLSVSDDERATALLGALREQSGLVDDEDALHEDLCVVGEAFCMVWPDELTAMPQAFRNDPRLCHAEYDGANPRRLRFAAKWWEEGGGVRLNLYYPDRMEYYATRREFQPGEMPDARSFEPWGEEPAAVNEYGVIPMFHFRTNRRRIKSQLDNVIELQDAVNKLFSDMMVAAEFAAYRQRYIISQAGVTGLKNVPFGIWDIPGGDGQGQPTMVGEFAHTPLSNYLEALNKLAADIGVITRTPRHYFFAQGGDPSGEALIAMEAPLNKRVRRIQTAVEPTWRDLAAFLLLLAGEPIPSQRIWAQYEPTETVQPKTSAEIRELAIRAGLPLRTVLRDEGWTAEDIAQLDADMLAEREAQATFADAAMTAAGRRFDAGNVA